MTILFCNYAGVSCNIINYLKFCLQAKGDNKVVFYYNDRFYWCGVPASQLNPVDYSHNIFYNFFEVPKYLTNDDFQTITSIEFDINQLKLHEKYPGYFETGNGVEIGAMNGNLYNEENRNKLKNVSKLFNEEIKESLVFKESYLDEMKEDNPLFFECKSNGKKVLTVMIRCLGHYFMNSHNQIKFDTILDELEKKIDGYDYIMPLTIVSEFYEQIKDKFGERCIQLNRKRTSALQDWTDKYHEGEDFTDELKYAMADIYYASQSDFVLGSSSSMFLLAMFLNPELKYEILQPLKGLKGA